MINVRDAVKSFHEKFGHPAPTKLFSPTQKWIDHRKKMIREEAQELVEALESGNKTKIAREACDLVYVTVGTLVAFGIPFLPCFREVHQANMNKVPAPDGMKPLRPEGWVSPDHGIEMIINQNN